MRKPTRTLQPKLNPIKVREIQLDDLKLITGGGDPGEEPKKRR
ncbi:MAG TPA: hypothetical protein VLX92_22040 [Kofleriaceae bacterium]|nr:hypothetical protein [Kofleriaceae bacterium]